MEPIRSGQNDGRGVKRLDVRELRKLGALPTSNLSVFPSQLTGVLATRPTWEVRYSLEDSRVTLRYSFCQGNAFGQYAWQVWLAGLTVNDNT